MSIMGTRGKEGVLKEVPETLQLKSKLYEKTNKTI